MDIKQKSGVWHAQIQESRIDWSLDSNAKSFIQYFNECY